MDSSSAKMEFDAATSRTPTSRSRSTTRRPRRSFVEGNPQAGMQAFMAGKVKVQGDMTKLMASSRAPPTPPHHSRPRRLRFTP